MKKGVRDTTGDIVTIPASYQNAAWGDYDDDGYLDLFVGASLTSTRDYLYHNNRDGTFTLIDDAAMPKIESNQHGAAWGDYDNDGFIDLFISGHETLNRLFHNNGDGSFTRISNSVLVNDPSTSKGSQWVAVRATQASSENTRDCLFEYP